MLDPIYKDTESRMAKTIEALDRDFKKIRTGRATPAILEDLRVNYYDAKTPVNQMANITAPEPRLLVIQPWDASAIGEIEKAILKSDLGLTPQNDGKIIRISIPSLTTERRKDLGKQVKKSGEEAKVAVRSIRQKANEKIKELKKNKEATEDEAKKAEAEIQKITTGYIEKIDAATKTKDKEIMEF
ncbi:MAG: ribosome recycling factor [Deltaproteobacteria bacterium]|jgi:ribosome recycling factor|nr:ribosome recycling factor [Deltaproteobacteria bacterium]